MCGIAGVAGLSANEAKQIVTRMNALQAHRGPDAEGIFVNDHVCLGHRRLSIIDLDNRSDQPMSSHNSRYRLVFNGEIYNFREIKRELKDYPFRTESDTEVLLAGFEKWGKDLLLRLNGMFAFAIWDERNKSLFLARDRLGIKPLYYSTSQGFSFSSELRALLSSGLVKPKINGGSIHSFLSNQSIQAPHTIIDEIYQLKPGHYGVYHLGKFEAHEYWCLGDQPIHTDGATTFSQLRSCLLDAVEKRLVADVDVAAFLSGGIDSSAIVGLMAELNPGRINTFSIGFDNADFDESDYAKIIAKRFKTDHHNFILKPEELLQKIPVALGSMDSPTSDGINTFIIAEAVRNQGIKVALSGLGGDELFMGYPVFKQLPWITKNWAFKLPLWVRKLLSSGASVFGSTARIRKLQRLLKTENIDLKTLYPMFRRIAGTEEINRLLVRDVGGDVPDLPTIPVLDELGSISAFELGTYTTNILLRDTDQMSMAHSLEVRVPFLDHELVQRVLSIPSAEKLGDIPKPLLIKSLHGLLPEEVIARKKQGFTLPWEYWLKNELFTFVEGELQKIKHLDLLCEMEVDSLWNHFKSGNPSVHWSRIWTLVVLSSWIDQHIN